MSRTELLRSAAVALAVWAVWNSLSAHANYAATQALPGPTDWIAMLGPALGSIAALFGSKWQPSNKAGLQKLLQAIATLLTSNLGGELQGLITALKTKGFPPHGSLNVTFQDGTSQSVEWSLKGKQSNPS